MRKMAKKITIGLVIVLLFSIALSMSCMPQEPTLPAPTVSTVSVYVEEGQYIARADSGETIASDADDAAHVIQMAIDALSVDGGKVILQKGIFKCQGSVIPKHNITIEGQGEGTKLELYGLESDYAQIQNYPAFIPIENLSNVQLKNLTIEVMVDFPTYPKDDFFIIRFDGDSTHLTFDGLHLKAKFDSANGTYGIYGQGQHITIRNNTTEYAFRGINSGNGAEDWLLENCRALHTPANVPWTISGFEFEDGSKNITTVDCYAEDIVQTASGHAGRGFVGGVHEPYAPAKNEHIKHIRPVVVNCHRAFEISASRDFVIEEPYLENVAYPFRIPSDGDIEGFTIEGGEIKNSGQAQLNDIRGITINGLVIRDTTQYQNLYVIGSGNPDTIDDIKLTNLKLINTSAITRGLRLRNVNGARVVGVISTGNHHAITFDGDYVKNVTFEECDFRGNARVLDSRSGIVENVKFERCQGYPD